MCDGCKENQNAFNQQKDVNNQIKFDKWKYWISTFYSVTIMKNIVYNHNDTYMVRSNSLRIIFTKK